MDLLVYAGFIVVYLLNVFLKKSSKGRGRANEESLNDPFEEVRREILRKKKTREGLGEAEVERVRKADKARETQAKKMTAEVSGPTHFQMHMEEQSQRIKEKQEEAKRLKAHLEQIKNRRLKEERIESHISNNRTILARGKVRAILAKNSDIKAALIAGEILAQPLALRTETNF